MMITYFNAVIGKCSGKTVAPRSASCRQTTVIASLGLFTTCLVLFALVNAVDLREYPSDSCLQLLHERFLLAAT